MHLRMREPGYALDVVVRVTRVVRGKKRAVVYDTRRGAWRIVPTAWLVR